MMTQRLPVQRGRVRAICEMVALAYDLPDGSWLLKRTNEHYISRPRHLAMYLTRRITGWSLPQVGRAFGGYHHTTVLYALEQAQRALLEPEFHAFATDLESRIRAHEELARKAPALKLGRMDLLEERLSRLEASAAR